MTDIDLVYKKLDFITACVNELRTFGDPGAVGTDLREQRFEAYTLQIAIQAALDIAAGRRGCLASAGSMHSNP